MKRHHCKRCGHKWMPRVGKPVACPACHSYKWNVTPRKKDGHDAAD